MAKKATLTPVTDTALNAGAINTQLNAINDQLDNTLSLDGSTPNAMNADVDLNSNDILNAGTVNAVELTVGGISVAASATASAASATASAASAAAALVSETNAATSETNAASSAVAASTYDPTKRFNTVALLLADTTLTTLNTTVGDYFEAGGFRYIRVASSGDVTTAGGILMDVLAGDDGLSINAFGAVGDGVTNDKTIIDTHNVAETLVNLSGKTYAYTGDFTPTANYTNGKILSSTLGEFDYTVTTITGFRTVTVGASSTMKTLEAALNWLKSGITIQGGLTLTVSGDHTLSNYTFDHPDSSNVYLVGTALAGAMPVKGDMVGTRATDEAFIAGRFTASIDVGGTGDNTTGGLSIPNGLGILENIYVKSNTRYSFDVGFSHSHGTSRAARRLRLKNCSIVGGVWGFIVVGAEVRIIAGGSVFFAYQNTGTQPGGPMDLINCNARFEGGYNVYSAGQSSKFGLYIEGGTTVYAYNVMDIVGPFLHGIYAKSSDIDAGYLVTSGVTSPLTANYNSFITCAQYNFSGGNTANTGTLSGAGQFGWGDNNASGAFVHAGSGSVIALDDGVMNDMTGAYVFHSIGGQINQGTGDVAIDDCKTTVATARFYTSGNNYLSITVTNPKAGSLDQVLALAQSTVRMGVNAGMGFSPAINTVSNGNLISNTG